jgi:hypothetical protein
MTTAGIPVTVSPGSGGPRTSFAVSFTLPATTGLVGSVRRSDTISISAPRRRGCLWKRTVALPVDAAGAPVRIELRPGHSVGWCVGTFHGEIISAVTIICGPPAAIECPLVVVLPATIARFSFRVRGHAADANGSGAGGGSATQQTTGPTFAGLVSATTCFGSGPQPELAVPAGSAYTLTWAPATDPVTPSAQIVYDVYTSVASGGESYTSPTWTTPAGATGFVTPDLPAADLHYFVVRARDLAGLEDANTVQQRGLNQCAGVSAIPSAPRWTTNFPTAPR